MNPYEPPAVELANDDEVRSPKNSSRLGVQLLIGYAIIVAAARFATYLTAGI